MHEQASTLLLALIGAHEAVDLVLGTLGLPVFPAVDVKSPSLFDDALEPLLRAHQPGERVHRPRGVVRELLKNVLEQFAQEPE